MPDIVGLNGGLVKTTPELTDLLPIQSIDGITRSTSIAGVVAAVQAANGGGGGGSSAWVSVTAANYSISAVGGMFAVSTSTSTVLKLPTNPPANTQVTYQIIDTTTNTVYVEPSGGNTIGNQPSGYRGKHNPSLERSAIETLRYIGGGKWLAYYGRLIYESTVAPTPPAPIQTINITVSPASIAEGNTVGNNSVFTITRDSTAASTSALVVNLAVSGTAIFTADYTVVGATSYGATTASINLPANQLSANLTLTSVPNTTVEPSKTVMLTIVPTSSVSQSGSSSAATLTILNDDTTTIADPYFANVKLLLPLDGDKLDRSSSPKAFVNLNSPTFATASPFGGSFKSLATTGSDGLVCTSTDFVIPAAADFCFEGFVEFTAAFGTTGYNSPAGQYFVGIDSQALDIFHNTYSSIGYRVNVNGAAAITQAAPPPTLDVWHFWQIQRSGGVITGYFDGVALGTSNNNSAIGSNGELRISHIIAGVDTNYGVVGNACSIRLTIGNTRPTAIPTAPFPTS